MPNNASARFRRKLPKPVKRKHTGERLHTEEYVYIYAWKKALTIYPPVGPRTATPFSTTKELFAAFVTTCERYESEGWTEYGEDNGWRDRIAGDAPKKPSAAEAEKRFEAMSAELSVALLKAKGRRADEKKAMRAALEAYGDLKAALGGDRLENAVHFFSVDGVGLTRKRKPALARARVDGETHARWSALLFQLAK